MIITARASHLPTTPRKMNLVAKSIAGLPATKALGRLKFTAQRASQPITKVLKQAIANATNNFQLDPKTLIIDTIFATKGRTLKRNLFGGRMRYKPFEKTASHLTINLRSATPKVIPVKKVATPAAKATKAIKPAKSKLSLKP